MGRRVRQLERGRPRLIPEPMKSMGWTTPEYGAATPRDEIPGTGDEVLGQRLRPVTFDIVTIVAVPASGTILQLVGPGAPAVGQVQRGYRGVIDRVATYLENAGGGPLAG